jgi:hypothetical protein
MDSKRSSLFLSYIKGDVYVTERQYQAKLIKKLECRFPGCFILKMDPDYQQGILDLIILHNDRWGTLEVKASANANVQPNQKFYVEKLNTMSFAAFIYPENEEEVLNALQQAFEPPRRARVSKSKPVPLGQLHAQ